jgi:hypothetical protein
VRKLKKLQTIYSESLLIVIVDCRIQWTVISVPWSVNEGDRYWMDDRDLVLKCCIQGRVWNEALKRWIQWTVWILPQSYPNRQSPFQMNDSNLLSKHHVHGQMGDKAPKSNSNRRWICFTDLPRWTVRTRHQTIVFEVDWELRFRWSIQMNRGSGSKIHSDGRPDFALVNLNILSLNINNKINTNLNYQRKTYAKISSKNI